MIGHPSAERRALPERAKGCPERLFEVVRLRGREAVGSERMADVALITDEVAVAHLPQCSAALRTRKRRRRARQQSAVERIGPCLGHVRADSARRLRWFFVEDRKSTRLNSI